MGPHNAEDLTNDSELTSEDVPSYQFTILHDSSDESNDDLDAYELLPQFGEDVTELPDVNAYNTLTDDHEDTNANDDLCKQSSFVANADKDEQQTRSDSISLDEERIEKIKLLMSGFSLPKSSYPIWASNVPEEEWKPFLDAKVADQHSSSQAGR